MSLVIFLLISIVFLLVIERTKRKFLLDPNLTRRISHVGATLICAASPLFVEKKFIVIVCVGFAMVMIISRKFSLF